MTDLRFVPYEDAAEVPNVVVDGSPNRSTVLTVSHWPGMPTPDGLAADLSAQMAFRYLDAGAGLHAPAEAVTNNHFDQDGLVGIFALVDPEAARSQRTLLEDVAAAGDFGTYRDRRAARMSMVLAAYADPARSPLGAAALAGPYPHICAALYSELLGRLPSLAADLDELNDLWTDEDAELSAAEAAIDSGRVTIEELRHVDLAVVTVPEGAPGRGGHRFAHGIVPGLHPMAVHNATDRFRILQIRGRRYELAYRYETWVQYRSRRPLPRADLAPLADQLNEQETGDASWSADGVDTLTPRLHLADGDESSLDPEQFTALVVAHLEAAPAAFDPYAERTSR